jgi:hypothetical protein
MLGQIRDRAYSDFLMPSRLGLYRAMLETALGAGYEIVSIEAMWRLIVGPGLDPARRYLALRHDVDTDSTTAAVMWGIDRELGVKSSYYFRLSTLAPALMADIAAGGGEASYHYEELATVAKRRGLRTRADVERHMPEAKAEFAANLETIRSRTGLPMPVVSSHGDFVNRRLGVANWAILADAAFRDQVGVEAEAYDELLIGRFTSQYSDVPHPRYWIPADPTSAFRAGDPVVFALVHPRHWRTDRVGNLRDDVLRAVEGVRYGLATRRRGPS